MDTNTTGPRSLHHYRLLERIGGGGMGVVWKAFDTRLEREVALKLLPDDWRDEPSSAERFREEALSLAAINHPNIVVIHSVESEGPEPYMVMELVRGRVLSSVFTDAGLQLHELLEYAIQIADAISAAHESGIAHRDLKPANVMITAEGRVKVLDFGLAKRRGRDSRVLEEADTAITARGIVVGTPAYMSPEQLRGEPATTASDVFALGAILFELATGKRPFSGETLADLSASVLRDDPAPPSSLRPNVPADLDAIVLRSLSRDPARRPTATEVREALQQIRRGLERDALRRLATAVPSPPSGGPKQTLPRSLLVLPFTDLSTAGDQEYFCMGLAEDIATELTRVEGLHVRVASRWDRSSIDPLELGRSLGVKAVLDGSVRLAKDQLRVTVRLANVSDGAQVWSSRFDRSPEDLFAVQDEVATAVAREYRMEIAPSRKRERTVDAAAYATYLRGRYFWNKRYEGGLQQALGYFDEALAADPDMALAHAGRADCFVIIGHYGFMPPRKAYGLARQELQQALTVEPNLAEAHATMGWIAAFFDWEAEEALRRFDRAIELDPSYATAWEWRGLFLLSRNRCDEAIESIARAQDLDPLSPMIGTMLGWARHMLGDLDAAYRTVRSVLDMEPRFVFAHLVLSVILIGMNRLDEAIATMERCVTLSNREGLPLSLLAHAYARAGRQDDFERVFEELQDARLRPNVAHVHLGIALAGTDRIDEAVACMQRAVENRESFLASIHFSLLCDPLREHPGFREALRGMRLDA